MSEQKKKLLENNDSITNTPETALEQRNSFNEFKIHQYKSNSNNRLSRDKMFMEIAKIVAQRSKDPRTKVGAVITKDKHIISIGYNGEPRAYTRSFDWHTDEKYKYVIHAELNAIANANYNSNNIVGSNIYLTLSPCKECIKLLIQFGVAKVYYLDTYKDFEEVKEIASGTNIELIKMEL